MYEIEFPIIIEKSLATYEYDFLARGYHAYMDIWNPLIGEVSKYKREATNEVDWHAVAIMQSRMPKFSNNNALFKYLWAGIWK